MGCCSIFDRSLYNDINTDGLRPDIDWLKRFINSYDITISGIWMPIFIESSHSRIEYGELLSQPRMDINNPFDPCNCTSDVIQNYTDLEADTSFGCSYCLPMSPTNFSKSWKLKDTNGNESTQSFLADCTSGACDTRMKKDDYLPKIPYVNQKYLNNQFYDFKYLKEFPAITNGGLGYEGFISGTASDLRSFSASQDYRIDWVLKPTLSEIAYNPLTSDYNNQDDHERAYRKSLQTNKTCGNFILTKVNPAYSGINPYYPIFSGLIGDPDQTAVTSPYADLLPKVSDFSAPYGFASNTYDNIFVKTERIGSHWKWNFTKGILGWYRHFDIDKEDDTRPIKGVDLYIAPGDVFWATNQGPEPAPVYNPTDSSPEIKSCPSGLKLIKNNIVTGVIPTGSEFTYISSNLYSTFLDIYSRIEKNDQLFNLTEDRPIEKFNLAAILCTAPQYDAITIDLLKANKGAGFNQVPNVLTSRFTTSFGVNSKNPSNYIDINSYGQNLDYNYDMTRSSIGSVNGFGFIKTKQDLIDTLVNKYGGYIWCPQDSALSINYDQKIKDQCYVDLSFDMVVPVSAVKSHNGCSSDTECSQFNGTIFSYDQRIGHKNILSTRINNGQKYTTTCSNGDISISSIAHVASLYLNGDKIKEVIFSSGCSIYQDTYPRIITSTSTRSCKYCEPESSYGLVTTTDNNVCKNGDGTPDNFCDYKLANYYNNSENPQAGLIGTRIGREILDGTLYFKRSYHAAAFDPHIDRVGFHHQNGIYFDSLAFGSQSGSTYFLQGASETSSDGHSISIGFDTKKAGIKLYGIKIEKLRSASADSANCLGFPNNEPCKCYGLNITTSHPYDCNRNGSITFSNNPVFFTPNLSTRYGPKIKTYGGYSEQYINDLFLDTNNRIPNHPDVGQTLNSLSVKINPEYPYGCEQSVNISLPNYVKTSWSFTVSNFDTNHADIWAEVLENVDLFNPNNYTEDEDGGTYPVSNIGYQRFANRVAINNKNVFDKQKKIVAEKTDYSSSRWSFEVVLTNPYLQSLIGDAVTLYPPTGTFCSNETVYGGRGDELTIVPIKLTRIPRKQVLNFGIHPIQPMGILKAGYFDPNKGIEYTAGQREFGPLYVNDPYTRDEYYFDYDGSIFPQRAEESIDPVIGQLLQRFKSYILVGDLTKQIRETLLKIQNLDVSKLRLYLQVGGRWYLYNTPNLFGYIANDKTYSGPPFLFEYAYKDDRRTTPSIITSCPKEHINFNYFRYPLIINFDFDNQSDPYKDLKLQYPAMTNRTVEAELLGNGIVRLEGIRPYFMFEETYTPNVSNATSISSLESTVVENINRDNPYVLLFPKKQIWQYKGVGDKYSRSSYILTSRDNPYTTSSFSYYDFLYTNYTSLNIDLSKTNSDGYVYNSYKEILNNSYLESATTIIESSEQFHAKYLKIEYVDKYGNKISKSSKNKSNVYPKVYTYFVLEKVDRNKIIAGSRYRLDISPSIYKQIVLYQSLTDTLKKELDHVISNPFSRAKWSDILNFDGSISNDITNYTFIKNNYSRIYPSSLYLNNFYKLILNPNKDHYNFYALINDNTYFSYHDTIYYNIHQKYSIGKEYNPNNNELPLLENYLPYIDLNFVGDSNPYGLGEFQTSGTVKISGMHKYLDADHDWEHYHNPVTGSALFWVNLDPAFNLQSCLSFNQKIYSDTFRIDDVPYQLYDINCTTNATSDGCRQTFYPIIPNSEIVSYNVFNFESDYAVRVTGTSPFVRFPVYCDSDTLDTCGSKSCGIKTVGSTACSGLYKIYEEKTIPIPEENLHNIPFIISAEEGLYNPIGNNQPHFIQRFELSPENPLIVSSGASCSLYPLRPKRDSLNNNNRLSVVNEDYQAALDDSIVNDHSDLVKNTDTFANEMLFRLMYGEKQKLNLNTLNQNNQSITYADLLKYTDPRVTAKDIYKNIPYEYDTTASLDTRIINGSISIQGVLRVGKSISAQIGSHNLSCSIIKENGDVKIQATYNGETIEGVIYQEYTDNNSIAVCSGPCSSPDTNTTYTLLKTCQELQQYSHSLSRVTTAATLFKQCTKPCGQSCTPEELTDLSFPYWPDVPGPGVGGLLVEVDGAEGPCITYEIYSPCATNYQTAYHRNNRGTISSIDKAIPVGCSIIANDSAEITYGAYTRGAFGGCYPRPMRTQVSADGRFNVGETEDFNGGLMIDHPGAIGDAINIAEPTCGTCFSLDYEDPLTKNKLYSVFGGGSYPPYPGSTSRSCDCADWEYGYCRNTNNASLCVCNGLQYDYSEFDYNFEYCRYNITLKGYKRRIKYPTNDRTIRITPSCQSASEGTIYSPGDIQGGGSGGRASESCLWIECPGAVPTTWHIYDVKSRTVIGPYNPLCPQQLCTITYDNNKIIVALATGQSKCWYFDSLSPNNSCPLLSVTVPDNTFTVVDSINSSCSDCINKEPKLDMLKQQQEWDIVEETRTCVLGYILTGGNPNQNGPVGIGGSIWVQGYCSIRGSLCYNIEGIGGIGQCGKNAPDSYPWSVCISYSEPQICRGGNSESLVTGCNIPVNFPYSNARAGERIVSLWKKQMGQIWLNTAPCHNNKNKYNTEDIVEGVVPDSCSQVKYTTISYPSMAYRATFGDPVVTQGVVTYTVAYYTYTYRRPKTIQDIFKGDELVQKCSQVTSYNPIGSSLNISEYHKTSDCSSVVQCYDINTENCDNSNYCCRYGKTNYE